MLSSTLMSLIAAYAIDQPLMHCEDASDRRPVANGGTE